jgi:hypothetical protein
VDHLVIYTLGLLFSELIWSGCVSPPAHLMILIQPWYPARTGKAWAEALDLYLHIHSQRTVVVAMGRLVFFSSPLVAATARIQEVDLSSSGIGLFIDAVAHDTDSVLTVKSDVLGRNLFFGKL